MNTRISLIFLFIFILNICTINSDDYCKQYDPSIGYLCKECKEGFTNFMGDCDCGPYQIRKNDKCFNKIPNCDSYDANGKCTSCEKGGYPSGDGKMCLGLKSCPAGLEYCRFDMKGNLEYFGCQDGYYVNPAYSQSNTNLRSDNVCLRCSDGCADCDTIQGVQVCYECLETDKTKPAKYNMINTDEYIGVSLSCSSKYLLVSSLFVLLFLF